MIYKIRDVYEARKPYAVYSVNGSEQFCIEHWETVGMTQDQIVRLIARRTGQPVKPVELLPVRQRGETVGYLPSNFDARTERPSTFLYEIRHDDFTLVNGEYWSASPSLCPGDFEALPSFRFSK